MNNTSSTEAQTLQTLPLRREHFWVLAVSSMEQLIGAGLSTIVGIIIPMLKLLHPDGVSSLMQGILGSAGLLGIAIGAPVIGNLSDKHGYLAYFRLCPVMIALASCMVYLSSDNWAIAAGLFLIGIGVGGGYSLDSDYLSELMPTKWRLMMVGCGKAMSSIGFFAVAGICWLIITIFPNADIWHYLILIIGILGLMTLLMRIRWWESPKWLLMKGRRHQAEVAAAAFFGPEVRLVPIPPTKSLQSSKGWSSMFKGDNLKKVILTGIPWACEGVGVYGVGVFLPILVMALGIDTTSSAGIAQIINSVELTTVINFFILPGFVLGLIIVRRTWHIGMLTWGFVISGVALGLLLLSYLMKWPVWMSIGLFAIFELALNAGPHLITFILPAQVYPIDIRGIGSGIASMFGKIGAIIGVFFMPFLLNLGGITLVLIVCIAVNAFGAFISWHYGRQILPNKHN